MNTGENSLFSILYNELSYSLIGFWPIEYLQHYIWHNCRKPIWRQQEIPRRYRNGWSADERASVWSSWSPSGSWLHCNNPEPAERQNHRDEDANMSHTNWHSSVSLMAYLHWWTRIRIPIPMATLYYAEHVHIAQHWLQIPIPYFCTGLVWVRTRAHLQQCNWAIRIGGRLMGRLSQWQKNQVDRIKVHWPGFFQFVKKSYMIFLCSSHSNIWCSCTRQLMKYLMNEL